jgi:hypothetical protein
MTDLIRLDPMVRLASNISLVITTSVMQSHIIFSVLQVNCFTALEPIDPLYENFISNYYFKKDDVAKIVFFGYSNSLERTSAHIAPYLNTIDSRFEIVVFSESIPASFRLCTRCNFLDFSLIQNYAKNNFCYVVLSDIPVDLSVATFAKSDNKLISSICMGFLPLVVRDSRYLKWLPDDYPYVFSTPSDLLYLINKKLDLQTDIIYFKEKLKNVLNNYHKAHLNNVNDFSLILNNNLADINIVKHYPLKKWPGQFSYGLKDSLNDLQISFSQAFLNRFLRLWRLLNNVKLWSRSR